MKTYKEALYAIAQESAQVKRAQYLSGANQYRGFDSHGIAATLSLTFERDFKEVRNEFEDLEFELYEELKLK
jgi:hypothetical protein